VSRGSGSRQSTVDSRQEDGETGCKGTACRAQDEVYLVHGSVHHLPDDPDLVEIRPEPSPAERAAILIALNQMIDTTARIAFASPSAWTLAGRRDALLGRTGGSRSGWGRHLDPPAGW